MALPYICLQSIKCPLQWRYNGRNDVSNNQSPDCLLNSLFRRRSKKTWKLCVTGLCEENSPVTAEFPVQMASNVENVSIWGRHHAHRVCASCGNIYICMYSSNHRIRKHDARRIKINHITTSLWNQCCLIQFCYVFLYPQNLFVLRFSRTGFIVIKRQYIKGISPFPMNLDVVSEPPHPWGYYSVAPLWETTTTKVEMAVTIILRKRCTRYVIKDNWSRARMIKSYERSLSCTNAPDFWRLE